jgi:exosome complex component RRP46
MSDNPRTLIQVIVQSLTSLGVDGIGGTGSGGRDVLARWKWTYVAAMINACTLALLDAGSIPMRGVVCAVPVAVVDSKVIANPPFLEDGGMLCGCFAYIFGDEDAKPGCVFSQWSGGGERFETFMEQARDLGEEAARSVWREMRNSRARLAGLPVGERNDKDDDEYEEAKMEI